MSNLIKPKFISKKISGRFSTDRTGSIKIYKKTSKVSIPPVPPPFIPHPKPSGDQRFAGLSPCWPPSLCSGLRAAIQRGRNKGAS